MIPKPKPGDPLRLSASQFMSPVIDAVNYVDELRNSGGALTGRGRAANGICYVKNGSGVDLVTGGVLGLDGVPYLYSDNNQGFLNEQTFNGVAPVYASHRTQFAVALEPAATNVLARCVVSGIVAVQVKFDPAAWWYNSATVGDIGTGMTKGLVACPVGGARILYPCWPIGGTDPTGTFNLANPFWSIVDIGSSGGIEEDRSFTLREDLTEGGTARAEIFTVDSYGVHVDTGEMVTVWDRHCEFHGTADVATGEAYRKSDTPDMAASPYETDVTYEIRRITCPNFSGCAPVS